MKNLKIKNKKKARARFLVLFLILIAIIFIINNKKNKVNQNITQISLLINNEEYSQKLVKPVYITSNDTVYLSIEDIKNIYDDKLLFDKEKNEIITTYKTKIAVINTESNSIRVNGTQAGKIVGIIQDKQDCYLPITDLKNVYNIEINVYEQSKIVTIDSLDEEMIKGYTSKKISVKQEQKIFSKTIAKIKKDEQIVIIEKYDNGWTKIRTGEGIIGFIKQKYIKDEKEIRQKLDLLAISSTEGKKKIIDASNIKNSQIENYNLREKYIEEIILEMIQNEYKTLCIELKDAENNNQYLERLIIESKPRLLEYGKVLEIINKE